MGSLLTSLKADQLTARKSKNTVEATLLTTLIGEASMAGKNDGNRESTDDEVLYVIRKFIKGAKDTMAVIESSSEMFKALENELVVLERYLPKQLSENELIAHIKTIAEEIEATTAKDMGRVMKELQTRFAGLYDGKVASQHVRNVLGG